MSLSQQAGLEILSVDKESNLSESNQSSILLQGENNLGFEKSPVKVNEAFKLNAISVDENTITVRWIVKENYYLYKDKISFSVKGATIEDALFPKSKLKVDEFLVRLVFTIHPWRLFFHLPTLLATKLY